MFELRVFQLRYGDVRACVVPADLAITHAAMDEMNEPVAQAYIDALTLCEKEGVDLVDSRSARPLSATGPARAGRVMKRLATINASHTPALATASGARASYRFLENVTAPIRNPHTRRAFARAATEFFDWLAAKGVTQFADAGSVHVATDIEELTRARSAPTAKLRLAAIKHLFDWMVTGQIMPTSGRGAPAPRRDRHDDGAF